MVRRMEDTVPRRLLNVALLASPDLNGYRQPLKEPPYHAF